MTELPVSLLLPAALLGASLGITALVSALETALTLLPAEGQRVLRRRHAKRARQVDALLKEQRQTMHALLFLDALLNLLVFLLLFLLVREWTDWGRWGQVGLGLILFVGCVLWSEILPKTLARQNPLRTLEYTAGFGLSLVRFLRPFARLWQKIENRFAIPLPEKASEFGAPEYSDLSALIDLAQSRNSLNPPEATLLKEVLDLGRQRASHAMTPRVDCFCLPDDLEEEEAASLLRTRRYHRVPVYGETPDDVLGILDVPRFLRRLSEPGSPPLVEQLEPPAFVPDTMPALDLLQSLLLRHRRMALLLDEYGGFKGLVTLSDLMEELFGHERPDSASGLYLEKIREDEYLASGQVRMDDLAEALKLPRDAARAETLAGHLLAVHGSIPRPGAEFELPGWLAVIRRSSRNRIKEVHLQRRGKDK